MKTLYGAVLLLLLVACTEAQEPTKESTTKDRYVLQQLLAQRPVDIVLNSRGETALFTPADLASGKKLFETNCINCHVGGNTLPNQAVSLALLTLKQATPPRDNLDALVTFMKDPKTYDGKKSSASCRDADYLSAAELDQLGAFILRASERAKGWGLNPGG